LSSVGTSSDSLRVSYRFHNPSIQGRDWWIHRIRNAFLDTGSSHSRILIQILLWTQMRMLLCNESHLARIGRKLLDDNVAPHSFSFWSFFQLLETVSDKHPQMLAETLSSLPESLPYSYCFHVYSLFDPLIGNLSSDMSKICEVLLHDLNKQKKKSECFHFFNYCYRAWQRLIMHLQGCSNSSAIVEGRWTDSNAEIHHFSLQEEANALSNGFGNSRNMESRSLQFLSLWKSRFLFVK
jgi:hypothetical protein